MLYFEYRKRSVKRQSSCSDIKVKYEEEPNAKPEAERIKMTVGRLSECTGKAQKEQEKTQPANDSNSKPEKQRKTNNKKSQLSPH